MFIKKYVFFLILCLVIAVSAFSQAKDISNDKYYSSLSTASQKGMQRSRRIVQQIKAYLNGMLIDDEEYIEEYLLPDKKKIYSNLS